MLDAQETKPTSSNMLRVRSQVTTLDARMSGERANQSVRIDTGRLGTPHVPGNQIRKSSRSSTRRNNKQWKNLRIAQDRRINDVISDYINFATIVERHDNRENQDQNHMARDDMKICDQIAIDKKSTSANHNILHQAREHFLSAYKSHAHKINQELLRNAPKYGLAIQLLDQRTSQRDLKPDSRTSKSSSVKLLVAGLACVELEELLTVERPKFARFTTGVGLECGLVFPIPGGYIRAPRHHVLTSRR